MNIPREAETVERSRSLAGRVAWVTGGASGMGRAIAVALAEAGASVAIGSLTPTLAGNVSAEQCIHLTSEAELESVRDELCGRGVRAFASALDVCSGDSVSSFHESVRSTLGDVDILVNAAGSSARHPVVDHPETLWLRVLDVNLSGPFRTIRACLPAMMQRRWGRIVNLASTAANVGAPLHAAYCSAKSGVLGLTRCVALEGAQFGVSCNAINPGFVATPQSAIGLTQQLRLDGRSLSLDDYRAEIMKSIPQKRFIKTSEIAALAVFLCTDRAFGITGQDLTVAGGSPW